MTKGDRVRKDIVDASIKLFAKYGFFSSSFQMIANVCGMKQTAILRHFPSKNALLMAVLDRISHVNNDITAKSLLPQDSAAERLVKYCQCNLEWACRFPEHAQIVLLLHYCACFDRNFASVYQKVLLTGREHVLEYLYAGEREGIFDFRNGNLDMIAQTIHEALIGIIINVISTRGELSTNNSKLSLAKIKYLMSHFEVQRSGISKAAKRKSSISATIK